MPARYGPSGLSSFGNGWKWICWDRAVVTTCRVLNMERLRLNKAARRQNLPSPVMRASFPQAMTTGREAVSIHLRRCRTRTNAHGSGLAATRAFTAAGRLKLEVAHELDHAREQGRPHVDADLSTSHPSFAARDNGQRVFWSAPPRPPYAAEPTLYINLARHRRRKARSSAARLNALPRSRRV